MTPRIDHSDKEIVTLLNQGHRGAFEFVYRKYAPDLYRFARRNISTPEDCEEIIQDVFESLWARRESLQVTTLKYYLLNMVRYKVIRYFQHSTVKKRYAEHFKLFEAAYATTGPLELDDTPGLRARIEKSIEQLPERCRVAINLRLTENLSNGDIAKRMNITKKTVEMYMFKAFNHLRASYENIYVE